MLHRALTSAAMATSEGEVRILEGRAYDDKDALIGAAVREYPDMFDQDLQEAQPARRRS